MFNKPPASLRLTLRALAYLLRYPDAHMRAALPQLMDALHLEHALSPARMAEVESTCRYLAALDPIEAEARYVDQFDRGRQTSLHLFEHVHGDSRDRGPARVDLLQTSLGIGIDICAAGLDAQVAYGIPKFRRLPGCGGTAAYTLSILQAMLSRFGHKLRVAINGKEHTGTYMMAAICNGGYYGGGYQAAPYAAMDDGLLDIVLVKPISRIQVAGILAKYKAGRHMQDADTIVPEFRSFMTFYRARSVEMQVLDNRPIIATIDGECAPVMELKAEVLPSALNVLLPRPACGSAVIRGLYECPMQAKAK